MQVHNIEQKTDEWRKQRLGLFTASEFHIYFGTSSTKNTALLKKAAERITGVYSDSDNFSNVHIDRGNELESDARDLYSVLTTQEVQEIGFVARDDYNAGCSPDGLVNVDGGLEIKCKDNHTHLYAITNNYIEPKHLTQCHFSMFVTGREWWDYCLYNPNFKNPLHIIRIDRCQDYIDKITTCITDCEAKIQKHLDKYQQLINEQEI